MRTAHNQPALDRPRALREGEAPAEPRACSDAFAVLLLVLALSVLGGCKVTRQLPPAPPRFNDTVRFVYGEYSQSMPVLRPEPVLFSNQTDAGALDPPQQVKFTMVRVPGDAAHGVEPFYLSQTEVTGAMFFPWATYVGLNAEDQENWHALDLHPSQISRVSLAIAYSNRPALGMSRTVAEQYCNWLSTHTGRRYRLPTEAEWEHAMRLAGPPEGTVPQYTTSVDVFDDGYEMMFDPPFLSLPNPVASDRPDRLGLYDLFGNASEWVTGTGDERVVRGGNYLMWVNRRGPYDPDWRGVEDLRHWDAFSPYAQTRWYQQYDYVFQGIRLACDADQAPPVEAGKP